MSSLSYRFSSRRKESLTVMLTTNKMIIKTVVCIIFLSFGRLTEGNNVTLLPDGTANVVVGKPLTLECIYSGVFAPFTFNFYLNPDTSGLQIRKSTCAILISAGYNTSLYSHSCNTSSVSLTILTISQSNFGQIWECDVSFISNPVPQKDFTVIQEAITTTVSSTPSSSSAATTITMTTTTTTMSTTKTEMGTTQNIMVTSSCTPPVMPPVIVIIGVSVSAFLFILLIIIICCCCQCCYLYHCLYHCRNDAELKETNDNQDDNTTAEDVTLDPEYVLSNALGESNTLDEFKQALPIKNMTKF